MRLVHVFLSLCLIDGGYTMKNIHIGSIIRSKLEESSLSIAEFAERINRTRPTVYDIFNRKSIDTDLLVKISEVLDYNFLQEVYLEKEKDLPEIVSFPRYIVGVEVDEKDLKEYLNEEHPVVLKVVDVAALKQDKVTSNK